MEKEIKILQLLNTNSGMRQSDIAKEANISVGKVNYAIKDLLMEEYIIKKMFSRKPHYILTEKGIDILEKYMKSSIEKKIILHANEKRDVRQAVILSAGRSRDFDLPVSLLEIGEKSLIERTIDLLCENNIEKILIITGYKNEAFDKIAREKNIEIVINDRYKWTGTMASLALANDFIKDDFILIESDVLFEERAISELLKAKDRDCVIITNESGSGDETFVELRDGYIYKMSKDIHQLNKIDGEMIGLSKISLEVFNKMMKEYRFNRNPYLNYEYMLLDIARNYKIGCLKIDDLVWSEVDKKEDLQKIIKYVYPRMKRKELEVKFNNIKRIVSEALKVEEDKVEAIEPIGGMTNKNYKITINGEDFVIRIPGAGTEDFIDRKNEKINSLLSWKLGINYDLEYFNEENGIKIAKYIKNLETLNPTTAKKEENMRLVAQVLKKLHNSEIKLNNEFNVFDLIVHYDKLIDKYNGERYKDHNIIYEKVMKLKPLLEEGSYELRPCHCDTVPENFIKSGEDKIYLIDWEYSGMNDPMWDLAAFSLECGFSEEDEELFINYYFNGSIEESHRKRIFINKILQDFLWSLWTIIKEARGDNFGSYGIDRYNRAIENLEKIEFMLV